MLSELKSLSPAFLSLSLITYKKKSPILPPEAFGQLPKKTTLTAGIVANTAGRNEGYCSDVEGGLEGFKVTNIYPAIPHLSGHSEDRHDPRESKLQGQTKICT